MKIHFYLKFWDESRNLYIYPGLRILWWGINPMAIDHCLTFQVYQKSSDAFSGHDSISTMNELLPRRLYGMFPLEYTDKVLRLWISNWFKVISGCAVRWFSLLVRILIGRTDVSKRTIEVGSGPVSISEKPNGYYTENPCEKNEKYTDNVCPLNSEFKCFYSEFLCFNFTACAIVNPFWRIVVVNFFFPYRNFRFQ